MHKIVAFRVCSNGMAVERAFGRSLLVEAVGVSGFPEPDDIADFKVNHGPWGISRTASVLARLRDTLSMDGTCLKMFEAMVGLPASRFKFHIGLHYS